MEICSFSLFGFMIEISNVHSVQKKSADNYNHRTILRRNTFQSSQGAEVLDFNSSHFYYESTWPVFLYWQAESSTISEFTLCYPVSMCQLQFVRVPHRWAAAGRALTQSPSFGTMYWRKLGLSLRHLKNLWAKQRTSCLLYSLFSVWPPLSKSNSCPSEEGLQLVELRVSLAPQRPDLALVQPETETVFWDRAPSAPVPLRADLVHRCTADLQFVVELVQAMCQVMHCACAQGAALSSRWVGSFGAHICVRTKKKQKCH